MSLIKKAIYAANAKISAQAYARRKTEQPVSYGKFSEAYPSRLKLAVSGRDEKLDEKKIEEKSDAAPIFYLRPRQPLSSYFLGLIKRAYDSTTVISADFNEFPNAIDERGNRYFIGNAPISDLFEFIKEQTEKEQYLPLDTVKNLTIDLILALHAFHASGRVICDFKPENFLIYLSSTGDYYLKQIDFDEVREVREGDKFPIDRYEAGGTYFYLAPERRALYHCTRDRLGNYIVGDFKSAKHEKMHVELNAKQADLYSFVQTTNERLALLLSPELRGDFYKQFTHLYREDPSKRGSIDALLDLEYLGGKDAFDKRREAAARRANTIKVNGETPVRRQMGDVRLLQPKDIRPAYERAWTALEAMEEPARTPAQIAKMVAAIKELETASLTIEDPELADCFKEAVEVSVEQTKAIALKKNHPLLNILYPSKLWFIAGMVLLAKVLAGIIVSAILFTALASPPVALAVGTALALALCAVGTFFVLRQAAMFAKLNQLLTLFFRKHSPMDANLLRQQHVEMKKNKVPTSTLMMLAEKGIFVRKTGTIVAERKCVYLSAQSNEKAFFDPVKKEVFFKMPQQQNEVAAQFSWLGNEENVGFRCALPNLRD